MLERITHWTKVFIKELASNVVKLVRCKCGDLRVPPLCRKIVLSRSLGKETSGRKQLLPGQKHHRTLNYTCLHWRRHFRGYLNFKVFITPKPSM
ncbi:hypothetical protein Zmor_010802 [Zophobas morio]|uniref:Uncharacterized protein n=1 Tax=Zophobas morio TaxID=2755281 RepID=A0AA38IPA2_9CUCU|nr:hypothetical protein Zmor_010802 [Zophobas morio]